MSFYTAASKTEADGTESPHGSGYDREWLPSTRRVSVPVTETVPRWPFARPGTPDHAEMTTRPALWAEARCDDPVLDHNGIPAFVAYVAKGRAVIRVGHVHRLVPTDTLILDLDRLADLPPDHPRQQRPQELMP